MITFSQKGDFSKLNKFFEKAKESLDISVFDEYGKKGVEALALATPIDTGKTASSWAYNIERSNGSISLNFTNSNINEGVPIAIVIQYGHATRGGTYVPGIDYINPALQPIFEDLADEIWKEVGR